jgi:hypothetical protein
MMPSWAVEILIRVDGKTRRTKRGGDDGRKAQLVLGTHDLKGYGHRWC